MKKQLLVMVICMFALTFAHAQQQQPSIPASSPPASGQQENPATQFPDGSAYKNSTITYNIIPSSNNTYGYDILVDGRLMVHQASIPAMPGNEGFKTKEDAGKVAELVISKIKKGEMPPTVSVEELQKLGVTK